MTEAGQRVPPVAGDHAGEGFVVYDDLGSPGQRRAVLGAAASATPVLPAAVLVGAVLVWPVLHTVYAAFVEDTGGGRRFAWFGHFGAALGGEGVPGTLGRTLAWAVVPPLFVTAAGLVVAVALRRRAGAGTGAGGRRPVVQRVGLALMLPLAVPPVAVAVMFRLLYDGDPSRGPLSAVVAGIGSWVGGDAPVLVPWLGPRLVVVAVMTAFAWIWCGLAVFAFGLALREADVSGGFWSAVHGAYGRPEVRRTAVVVFALVGLASVRTFDLVLIMVPGSVLGDASVLGVTLWQAAGSRTPGPAAALGVLWLAAMGAGVVVAAWRAWFEVPPEAARSDASAAWRGLVRRRQAAPAVPPGAADVRRLPGVLSRALRSGAGRSALVLLCLWAFPVLVMVGTSLHGPREAATGGWWTRPPGLGSYDAALAGGQGSYPEAVVGGELWRSLVSTAGIATMATAAVVVLAFLAAYALSWLAPPRARFGSGVLLAAAAVIPVQVVAGPIASVLDVVRLTDTLAGLVLVHVALGLPFAVLLLRAALDEAVLPPARTRWPKVVGDMASQVTPAVVAVAALEFVQVWNDLVVGLLFGSPETATVGALVHGASRQFTVNGGMLAATAVIVSAVPLTAVVLARRSLANCFEAVLR